MKKILNIVTVLLVALSLQAYEASPTKIHKKVFGIKASQTEACPGFIPRIKEHFASNRHSMTGSFTVLKSSSTGIGNSPFRFDASFRNTPIESRAGTNYIQANAQALRNDNNSTNEFRIYVPHDNGNSGVVDVNNIKINWKDPGKPEVAGKLSNVTVICEKYYVLITGTLEKDDYSIAVNLGITIDPGRS